MNTPSFVEARRVIGPMALVITLVVSLSSVALAHCDTLDGPVVKAAQQALSERDLNRVLIWIQKSDEAELKRAFELTLTVRALGPEARRLADHYFYETLVRIHRAGEGAPYTGLKAAGAEPNPAVRAGDQALKTHDVKPVQQLLIDPLSRGVQERFKAVMTAQGFAPTDVDAGRAYVRAYVSYIHYVEHAHRVLTSATHPHPVETPNAHSHDATDNGQSSRD